MKKTLLLILALSLLLCACAVRVPAEEKAPEAPAASPAADAGKPLPDEKAPEEDPILDGREPVGDSGALWALRNGTVESGRFQTLTGFGGDLLLSSSVPGGESVQNLNLQLVSARSGELIADTALRGVSNPVLQNGEDGLLVCDGGAGRVTRLSPALETLGEIEIPVSWNQVYVSPDCGTLYTFNPEGTLTATDLRDGTETRLLSRAVNLCANALCGDYVMLSYTDLSTELFCYASLDLTSGALEQNPFGSDYDVLYRQGDLWLGELRSDPGAFYLGTRDGFDGFLLDDCDCRFLPGGDALLSRSESLEGTDSTVFLTLYDYSGRAVSSCSLPLGEGYLSQFVPTEKGIFFLSSYYSGETSRLFFWDSTVAGGESLSLCPGGAFARDGKDGDVSALRERADALSDEFGVRILLGSRCLTEFDDYRAELCEDDGKISFALDQLESALCIYPGGFFPQLYHDDLRSIEIQLVGALTPKTGSVEDSRFGNFTGFMQQTGGKYTVVMDISGDSALTGSFYHEITHMIDSKLAADARLRSDALFSEQIWASLNPMDFDYAYSYYGTPDCIREGLCDDYFTDIYARTFPTEDRARLMEYAMTYGYLLEGQIGMLEKLGYYSSCIRDCFDTAGWPAVTLWEQALRVG